MLNQEDKKFITTFVTGSIKAALTELKSDLQGQMQGLKTDLEGQMQGLKTDLTGQMQDIKDSLQTEIRHNGVLIEGLQDVVYSIAEGVDTLNGRVDRLEKDVAEIKENISDLPTIRRMVKRHDRELAELRR